MQGIVKPPNSYGWDSLASETLTKRGTHIAAQPGNNDISGGRPVPAGSALDAPADATATGLAIGVGDVHEALGAARVFDNVLEPGRCVATDGALADLGISSVV